MCTLGGASSSSNLFFSFNGSFARASYLAPDHVELYRRRRRRRRRRARLALYIQGVSPSPPAAWAPTTSTWGVSSPCQLQHMNLDKKNRGKIAWDFKPLFNSSSYGQKTIYNRAKLDSYITLLMTIYIISRERVLWTQSDSWFSTGWSIVQVLSTWQSKWRLKKSRTCRLCN